MQRKLDEEESKNIKLQQHINKLEHHSAQIQEVREQYNTGLYGSMCIYDKVVSTTLIPLCCLVRSAVLLVFLPFEKFMFLGAVQEDKDFI